jgi:hypothetical protein
MFWSLITTSFIAILCSADSLEHIRPSLNTDTRMLVLVLVEEDPGVVSAAL